MGLAQPKDLYTPEEYLRLERESDVRHEYIDGEIFEMAGAGKRHNQISANLMRLIGNRILERDCSIYSSDMRVKIPIPEKYTYPDLVGTCGGEKFEEENEDTLLNPNLLVEILSKSTEAYDRGTKFEFYQTIESFSEYILITQEPYRVEQFIRRDKNTWTYLEFRHPDDVLKLESVGCEISLRDIYHKVEQKFPKKVV
jgi:Uma2 family endonuclease